MWQKDDPKFTAVLNRFRTALQTEKDIKCINTRLISASPDNYPSDALHIWAENCPVSTTTKNLEQLYWEPLTSTYKNLMLRNKTLTEYC